MKIIKLISVLILSFLNFVTYASSALPESLSTENRPFVIAGGNGTILTSLDGINWNKQTQPNTTFLTHAAKGKNNYVVLGYGVSLTSPNGLTWTSHFNTLSPFLSLIWDNKQYVAVNINSYSIQTSPDGITWTPRHAAAPFGVTGVAYGNNTYVAVFNEARHYPASSGGSITSRDLITWSKANYSLPYALTYVQWIGQSFMATAQRKADQYYAEGGIATSSDGQKWVWHSLENGKGKWIASITRGNKRYVAVGADMIADRLGRVGVIYTSEDGITWNQQLIGKIAGLTKVIWSQSQHLFLAIGLEGTVMMSPDGLRWKALESGTKEYLYDIVQ